MTDRILFIDDEPRILDGIRRTLRGSYDVQLAEGGSAGLAALEEASFAVVVTDMMMPEIRGSKVLAEVAQRQPDAVQVILSGQADMDSTVEAVNGGNVFRFLLKPIDREALSEALDAALEQYRLRTVERDLLEQTLTGAVTVLGEILAMASPEATRRASIVRRLVDAIAERTEVGDDWRLKVAAALANIGCVAVPVDVLQRAHQGAELTTEEAAMVRRHPQLAAGLIEHIPRFADVARIVEAQSGPEPESVPTDLVEQTRILRLATAVADRVLAGSTQLEAVDACDLVGGYTAHHLAALRGDAVTRRPLDAAADQLRPGMILRDDLRTSAGAILATAGTPLNGAVIERIRNFVASGGIDEPIEVFTIGS